MRPAKKSTSAKLPSLPKRRNQPASSRRRREVQSGSSGMPGQTSFMGNKVVQVQRGITPFAASYRCRLRYCELLSITTPNNVNTAAVYTWRLNSLFDPNYTGTGHQPYQYDQLTPIYNNYLVFKATFQATFKNYNATSPQIWVGASVFIDTNVADTAASKDLPTIREKAVSQCSPLSDLDNRQNWVVLRGTIPMARCFGISETTYLGSQTEFASVYSTSPSRVCYLELFALDGAAGASSIVVGDIEIVYDCLMYGYKGPAQS